MSASRVKKRILIVDDDQNQALLLRSLMQANGYKALLAGSKPEGVKMAQREKPSCIILNCMMCGGEEGFCLYRHLKSEAQFRDVPVIMLCSVSRDILFRYRSMAGAFGGPQAPEPEAFLKSPPDAVVLVNTVGRLTGSEPSAAAEPVAESTDKAAPSPKGMGPPRQLP